MLLSSQPLTPVNTSAGSRRHHRNQFAWRLVVLFQWRNSDTDAPVIGLSGQRMGFSGYVFLPATNVPSPGVEDKMALPSGFVVFYQK